MTENSSKWKMTNFEISRPIGFVEPMNPV